ncbi:hypothetical protein BDD12DRAFT_832980 [Trichophaea hybrida]|nr:hypothetical protein BDD12DRAFT_832980 [Trichophaea hybrida]
MRWGSWILRLPHTDCDGHGHGDPLQTACLTTTTTSPFYRRRPLGDSAFRPEVMGQKAVTEFWFSQLSLPPRHRNKTGGAARKVPEAFKVQLRKEVFSFFTFTLLLLHDVHFGVGPGLNSIVSLPASPPSKVHFSTSFLVITTWMAIHPSILNHSMLIYNSPVSNKNALVFHRKRGTCIQSQGLV